VVSPFTFLSFNSVRISHLPRYSAHFNILHLITLTDGTQRLDDIREKDVFGANMTPTLLHALQVILLGQKEMRNNKK
jgi:hypothetical protein